MALTSAPVITDLLHSPTSATPPPASTRIRTTQNASTDFILPTKTYQQQFSDMYFLRLSKLKPHVERLAAEAWSTFSIAGERARGVPRVLDVRQGELCWISGTVYLDMPLKPNILDDISADHFLAPPPPREKYRDAAVDQMMLEDESGRLRLTGGVLDSMELVTGVVIAVLGSETADGEFAVVDVRVPELPPQRKRKPGTGKGKKIAIASGLGICGAVQEPLEVHLLCEYLLGEAGGDEDHTFSASISQLILAGNSLGVAEAPLDELNTEDSKKARTKKYGYDASAYNSSPTRHFDAILSSLCPSIPVTLLPGQEDPANISLPQQPLHPALFPTAKAYDTSTLHRTTNPISLSLPSDDISLLVSSGQNLDDIYKYVYSNDRVDMVSRLLRWRIFAPTAPDTLWSYPFQDDDPFVITECPDVVVVGNQEKFETGVVEGEDGQMVRVVLVPRFDRTGEIAVVDLETLEVGVVGFRASVNGVDGGGGS